MSKARRDRKTIKKLKGIMRGIDLFVDALDRTGTKFDFRPMAHRALYRVNRPKDRVCQNRNNAVCQK